MPPKPTAQERASHGKVAGDVQQPGSRLLSAEALHRWGRAPAAIGAGMLMLHGCDHLLRPVVSSADRRYRVLLLCSSILYVLRNGHTLAPVFADRDLPVHYGAPPMHVHFLDLIVDYIWAAISAFHIFVGAKGDELKHHLNTLVVVTLLEGSGRQLVSVPAVKMGNSAHFLFAIPIHLLQLLRFKDGRRTQVVALLWMFGRNPLITVALAKCLHLYRRMDFTGPERLCIPLAAMWVHWENLRWTSRACRAWF